MAPTSIEHPTDQLPTTGVTNLAGQRKEPEEDIDELGTANPREDDRDTFMTRICRLSDQLGTFDPSKDNLRAFLKRIRRFLARYGDRLIAPTVYFSLHGKAATWLSTEGKLYTSPEAWCRALRNRLLKFCY